MGLIKKILRKFDNKQCYFYQKNKCIIHNKTCINCNSKIKKIDGIDKTIDYVNIVINRRHNKINLLIAILSLFISIIAVILSAKK